MGKKAEGDQDYCSKGGGSEENQRAIGDAKGEKESILYI